MTFAWTLVAKMKIAWLTSTLDIAEQSLNGARDNDSPTTACLCAATRSLVGQDTPDTGARLGDGLDQVRAVKYPSQPAFADGRRGPVGLLVHLPG